MSAVAGIRNLASHYPGSAPIMAAKSKEQNWPPLVKFEYLLSMVRQGCIQLQTTLKGSIDYIVISYGACLGNAKSAYFSACLGLWL